MNQRQERDKYWMTLWTTDGWTKRKRERIGWKWWMKRKEERRNWIKLLDKKMDKMQQGRDKRWDETLDKGWMKRSKEVKKMDEMNERAQESAQEPRWLGNFIPSTPQLSLTYLLSGRWWVLCVWGGGGWVLCVCGGGFCAVVRGVKC
jgi:hypothetical protein